MLEAVTILVTNYALHVHCVAVCPGMDTVVIQSVLEKFVVLLSALSLSVNELVVVQ